MKFRKTFTNKLVSYADRYFTWDSRKLKREDGLPHFDFFAVRRDGDHKTIVCFHRNKYGIWANIEKDGVNIYSGFLKSYSDVANFKKMVRCLG